MRSAEPRRVRVARTCLRLWLPFCVLTVVVLSLVGIDTYLLGGLVLGGHP